LLGEAAGLSAGASASELAEVMDSGELRTYFSRLDLAGFRPGGEAEEPELTPAARERAVETAEKTLAQTAMSYLSPKTMPEALFQIGTQIYRQSLL
jgi:hypothetical protein